MKNAKWRAMLALGLVLGLCSVGGAQQRAIETGTEGWDVNAQTGTTNQGLMAYGTVGIRIPLGRRPVRNPRTRNQRADQQKSHANLRKALADHAFYPGGVW